jgi:hypothetical protein
MKADSLIIRLNLSVLGSLISQGNLSVTGDSVFNGKVTFRKDAEFDKDMVFNRLTTFSPDTAGFATIQKGKKEVIVNFTQEHPIKPMISADISILPGTSDDEEKIILDALSKNELVYTIRNLSTKGFVIELISEAPADIRFSWWQVMNLNSITTTTIVARPDG